MSPSIVEVVASDHHDDRHDDQGGWLDSIHAVDQKASHLLPDDQMFLTAALSLKNQVVDATWKGKDRMEVESMMSMDPTVYTGLMGTAFTCLCSYEATGCRQDLLLCADIVTTCATLAHINRHVTFLCGRGGIYALGAVVANYLGDHQSRAHFLDLFLEVFPNERDFRDGAIEAGEVVWKNGLLKRPGLADGASGNAYAFLALYRLTGEHVYIERARAFASFLYHNASDLVNEGFSSDTDHAYSLFLGIAGTACLFFDLLCPERAKFPGYEL